jgi:tryptophanyl-tRNA synthetase
MSADILLYDADFVPVGADQMSHIELCKDLAEKFNKRYPGTFKLPSGVLNKTTSKIMSLSNPTRKMSKSESDKGTIYLLDDIEVSKKKIMKAVTDSENCFRYDPETKPGLSNLISIYSALSGQSIEEVVEQYKETENYGIFKRALCELLEKELKPIQERVKYLKATNYCEKVLETGAAYANSLTHEKMKLIYQNIGIQ